MKFSDLTLAHVSGERFSNGLVNEFAWDEDDWRYRSRIAVLTEICRGRRLIHVGCVDHDIAQIEHKRARGKWLHEQLVAVAERCYGVDLSEEGVAYLRDKLGFKDVEAVNLLTTDSEEIRRESWDFLLLGEVIEHLNDPVAFLAGLKDKFAGRAGGLIITTPNAFARENFQLAGRGIEAINTDHRYWFTPFTLGKIVVQAGLKPLDIRFCRNGVIKRRSFLRNRYYSKHPLLRNNIVMRVDW